MQKKLITNLFFLLMMSAVAIAQTTMDLDAFKAEFNAHKDKMRVVAISDPSCPSCIGQFNQMINVFENNVACGEESNIRFFFVWTKVLNGSKESHATNHTGTYNDSRYIHYWDEGQLLGDAFMTTLNLVNPQNNPAYTAWHTVMYYEQDVEWTPTETVPPFPTQYQHKLTSSYNADADRYWNLTTLASEFDTIACNLKQTNTGIYNVSSEEITIFPNPSNDMISITGVDQIANIRIVDIMGRNVALINGINKSFINVSDLNNGMYYLHFEYRNQSYSKSFLVEHH